MAKAIGRALARQKGFTLAEVLITLVVIGIIAAITVPMIQANYKKTETVSKLKKTYSTLSQLVNRSQMDNGPVAEWYDSNNGTFSADLYDTYIQPYIRAKKVTDANIYNVVNPFTYLNKDQLKIQVTGSSRSRVTFILDDGVLVFMITQTSGENGTMVSFARPMMYVDVNGTKKPNVIGRDVFILEIDSKKGLKPMGFDIDSKSDINNNCSKKFAGNQKGKYCLEKIIRDSWEIKSDYPW